MGMFGYQWRKTLRLCNSHAFLIVKSVSSSSKIHFETEGSRFTVSYLINSCGFSLEAAKSLSKKVNFSNPKNPDSVIELFKKNGFTNTQINSLIRRTPDVLVANPDKNLLPKLELFKSVGMSSSEISELVSSPARIWRRSLKKHIIPCYNFFKNMLIDDSTVVHVLKRALFLQNYTLIPPNITILQRLGVPESSISYLLTSCPNALCKSSVSFDKDGNKVIEMGCDPLERAFVRALRFACGLNEKSWQRKFEVYGKLGWSEDEMRSVFRRQPVCMGLSEENITRKMDFFVNKMGYSPIDMAKRPIAILYSFDKRIIPRCSVVKALLMRRLIEKKPALSSLLNPSDSDFVDKFVLAHHDHSAELLNIFQGSNLDIVTEIGLRELATTVLKKPELFEASLTEVANAVGLMIEMSPDVCDDSCLTKVQKVIHNAYCCWKNAHLYLNMQLNY